MAKKGDVVFTAAIAKDSVGKLALNTVPTSKCGEVALCNSGVMSHGDADVTDDPIA